MLATKTPSSGPLITGSIAVSPNTLYNVKVEIMSTDVDGGHEYLDITMDGQSFGQCNPSGSECGCGWWTCSLSKSQLTTSSSNIPIRIQYSSQVDNCICTYDGLTGNGVARITFTPP